jgi:hypothetical protein
MAISLGHKARGCGRSRLRGLRQTSVGRLSIALLRHAVSSTEAAEAAAETPRGADGEHPRDVRAVLSRHSGDPHGRQLRGSSQRQAHAAAQVEVARHDESIVIFPTLCGQFGNPRPLVPDLSRGQSSHVQARGEIVPALEIDIAADGREIMDLFRRGECVPNVRIRSRQ